MRHLANWLFIFCFVCLIFTVEETFAQNPGAKSDQAQKTPPQKSDDGSKPDVKKEKGAPEVKPFKNLPPFLVAEPPRNLAEAKEMEKHIKSLKEKIFAATVSVSGGSGVIVSPEGHILSVGHVGQKAGRKVKVYFANGKVANAETLGNNLGIDAGMMKITDKGNWPYVDMGESQILKKGQWCLAVGFPVSFSKGKEPAIRLGRILNNGSTAITTDTIIMGGDSGGPLFDLNGNVIALNSRVSGSTRGNIHVPVDRYKDDWERFASKEDWGSRFGRPTPQAPRRVTLGVRLNSSTTSLKVDSVTPDSAADLAGIRAGDIIETADGKPTRNRTELGSILGKKKPGDWLTLTIKRGETTLILDAKLKARE